MAYNTTVNIGFLIMQIGNAELDQVCERVMVPALAERGLAARRVDKHNRGELLKSEIIRFIESADIILADLTNERPNCYLEIGFAMGIDKFANLILTCRDDHRLDSPKRLVNGPKVHFDLSGYDILFWQPDDLDGFRQELVRRINRRLAVLAPQVQTVESTVEKQWIEKHREAALAGLHSLQFTALMEVTFSLVGEKINKKPGELMAAADSAAIKAFGWPIAVVLMNNSEARPKPTAEGIVAEISSAEGLFGPSYDYWTLRRDGLFFLLHSLFEDNHNKNAIYFDTRIVRVTETVLYSCRLYNRLGIPSTARVRMTIKHSGLKQRSLLSGNPRRIVVENRRATEDAVEATQVFGLNEVDSKLVELVKGFLAPVFEVFDFCEFKDQIYSQIVDGFVKDVGADRTRP